MDLNLLNDDKVPLTISEDILRYLQYQDDNDEGEEGTSEAKLTNFTETQIKAILEELLQRFEKRQQLKESYLARAACHNQRELIDLTTLIDDFNIDDDMYEALTFRETLVIARIDDVEKIPVGGMCLDIQKAIGKQVERKQCEDIEVRLQRIFNKENVIDTIRCDDLSRSTDSISITMDDPCLNIEDNLDIQNDRSLQKFLIHVQSQFDVNGSNAGSCITAWVDRKFHTMEELRREFCDENYGEDIVTNEKDLYVGMVKNYYYIKHKSSLEGLDDRKFYSFNKTSKYISEGANFILQRYLAVTRFIGIIELSAMYINGDMCRNIYDCTGPESEIVNDTKLDICKIERTIIEECGIEHKCYSTLTLQGQLLHQEWEGIPYILMINPQAKVTNEKPTGNEQILLKHSWEKDMQLFSCYLDEKVKAEMRIKSYMIDHPEFKGIIMDYINAILLLKPEDILDFTMNHFMSFSPTYMPKNDYFD